jgi:hypothetical protein
VPSGTLDVVTVNVTVPVTAASPSDILVESGEKLSILGSGAGSVGGGGGATGAGPSIIAFLNHATLLELYTQVLLPIVCSSSLEGVEGKFAI